MIFLYEKKTVDNFTYMQRLLLMYIYKKCRIIYEKTLLMAILYKKIIVDGFYVRNILIDVVSKGNVFSTI